ncbi:DUF4372 domain-containing protein, partial [Candidatus Kaiserbacteria bacterium]|nr:DUF4372 domain-containing protein [Candidatus Kaiserbacteria bacterium]
MHIGTYVFSEIMECIPRRAFEQCVARHRGNRYAKML